MNNEWNVYFLQNTPFNIQYTYSNEFSIGWKAPETLVLIWYEAALLYSLNVLHILKS